MINYNVPGNLEELSARILWEYSVELGCGSCHQDSGQLLDGIQQVTQFIPGNIKIHIITKTLFLAQNWYLYKINKISVKKIQSIVIVKTLNAINNKVGNTHCV